MITDAITKLMENEDLTYNEAFSCMNEIFENEASEIQVAA